MKHKALNISLPPDIHAWLKKRAEAGGISVPVSRVVAHALNELKTREERRRK